MAIFDDNAEVEATTSHTRKWPFHDRKDQLQKRISFANASETESWHSDPSAKPNKPSQTYAQAIEAPSFNLPVSPMERFDLAWLAQHLVDLVEMQLLEHDHLARILL